MRIALFQVSRIVSGRGADGWPRQDRLWLPALTIRLGHLLWQHAFGVEVTVGVLRSRHEGERWARWVWTWPVVTHETLVDHPWTWWSPIRPIIASGRLRGFHIALGAHRRVIPLRNPGRTV